MRNIRSTLLHKWFDEVWNNNDIAAIDRLMTHDSNAHGIVAPGQPKGAEGFKVFFEGFRSQFHDVKIDIEDVICQDDMESARTKVSAIHTASGKDVEFNGICMVRIDGGKIAEAWNNYDFLSMHQQLGQKLVASE